MKIIFSPKQHFGKENHFYGKHHTEESKQKNRLAHLGKTPVSAIKKGEQRGKKTQFKKGQAPWNKGRPYKQKEQHWNWKGGLSYQPYTIDWTETLKRAIREKYNYICQLCSQYGNNVHHIDYDKKNCNQENLIVLCTKCHLKTNHNRNYWIKYFKNKHDK